MRRWSRYFFYFFNGAFLFEISRNFLFLEKTVNDSVGQLDLHWKFLGEFLSVLFLEQQIFFEAQSNNFSKNR
jgi:hypothetical protein